ncbi:ParB N-terminal domain-containing protein [Paraburkholderia tropica]|uniref:ParB N-terminal domain-containing protein n=1 Tax=Paraburkholderia tropica TaxID=92647 RepID=UPI003D2981F1
MTKPLELHPLCTFFPRIEGVEFEALTMDIRENGLHQPIVVHEGLILDGGNRYRACLEAGVTPRTVKFSGADPVLFVLSANLHRRHLTPGQQAAIVSAATDWLAAAPHGGDRKSDRAATLPLETVADRVAHSGASERTQRMADKVAKADPELAKKVAHGEVSLPKAVKQIDAAAADQAATLPLDSAAEIIDQTAPVARKPSASIAQEALDAAIAERDEARENETNLADALAEAKAELDAYRAGEMGEGEKMLAAANRRVLSLEAEVRRLADRRDALMNENAQLKSEVKRLRKAQGLKANG